MGRVPRQKDVQEVAEKVFSAQIKKIWKKISELEESIEDLKSQQVSVIPMLEAHQEAEEIK